MSIPPLPAGAQNTAQMRAANNLHSLSIHLLRRARQSDRETDLNPERLSLLSVLAYEGTKSINQLSSIEGISAPAISRSVTSLEKLGLAARKRSDKDARTVMVHATAKGKKLMEAGRRRRLENIADTLSVLSKGDIEKLKMVGEILKKLYQG